jgi:hypothetical protein
MGGSLCCRKDGASAVKTAEFFPSYGLDPASDVRSYPMFCGKNPLFRGKHRKKVENLGECGKQRGIDVWVIGGRVP